MKIDFQTIFTYCIYCVFNFLNQSGHPLHRELNIFICVMLINLSCVPFHTGQMLQNSCLILPCSIHHHLIRTITIKEMISGTMTTLPNPMKTIMVTNLSPMTRNQKYRHMNRKRRK